MTVSHRGARNQELNESTATSKQWFLEAKCPFSREKGEIHAHAREMGGHATCSHATPVILACARLSLLFLTKIRD